MFLQREKRFVLVVSNTQHTTICSALKALYDSFAQEELPLSSGEVLRVHNEMILPPRENGIYTITARDWKVILNAVYKQYETATISGETETAAEFAAIYNNIRLAKTERDYKRSIQEEQAR
ncbi:MAG TPA: hypothetical protein PKB13_03645 [Clostridia bacterium]|nr:hypothetical protein [Clostridia bacterium]